MDKEELEGLALGLRELAHKLGGAPQAEHADLLLALDQGGHASRALVFDTQGRQVAQAFAPIGSRREGADRVEHDPIEMIESLRIAITDIAQTLGADADRIVAAGLATQRSSVACWDKDSGAPLSPILSWQDRRNAAFVETLRAEAAHIQELTGLVLSPHYGASKLRWCLDEIAAVRAANEQQRLCAGPLASFLLYSLLEEHPLLADPGNASRTQLWSPATRDWSPELLRLFGIPRDILPSCASTHHAYGTLMVGKQAVPLTICTGDQAAAPFAYGPLQADIVYLNLGTGAFLLASCEQDLTNAAPYLRSVLWSDAERVVYALEGTINGAGSALDWLNDRIGVDTHRAARSLKREHLANLNVPIFINGVSGMGSPFWSTDPESRFIGAGDELGQVAAVVESIAFLVAVNLEGLKTRLPQLARIAAGGGLAESNYLCACIADLSGWVLERSDERELTAKGLAFLLAKQPSDWRRARNAEFSPQTNAELHNRYIAWQAAMQAALNS